MAESLSDKHFWAKKFIRTHCPNLRVENVNWDTASEPTDRYNCFGFAVGDRKWWEPPDPDSEDPLNSADHWPAEVPADRSIDAYVKAAEVEGFVACDSGGWVEGFDIIVLYFVTADRSFTHAAKQKTPGIWESKMGTLSDIEHTFDGLDNSKYGSGRLFMRRRKTMPGAKPE